ncbi:DUF397 domain-containing protein [Streptomyces sp. M54]|uniref:DUF397 domain-containing protein n=1 Tax=Streptomyces sp. M54 TaxID=2759525 RepID=UPI001A902807|nr:DUF397 domain-containing protein [Streptomyces sp. M54]QSS91174.1 DUF397 domain-containing protein [Streptomyces sp. M54]
MQGAPRRNLTAAAWRSSSCSNEEGGDCVQVADGFPGVVPVRDSKNPTGPSLTLTADAWTAFITGVVAR